MPRPIRTDSDRLAWLRLIRSENVGPITFFQLLRHYGDPATALSALPELAREGGRRRSIRVCPKAEAEREMAAIAAAGARLVTWGEADYPLLLGAIADAPPVIIVRGHVHLGERQAVGVVGMRNASANGCRLAAEIAGQLGTRGIAVASGLARGIDGAAHTAALATGTIAAIAGGIDIPFPPEHASLMEQIAEAGLLIAEQPPGTIPQARHFPRRNRIISGLSQGVVVVEAPARSGALITARLALEQGREVFAIPGSPRDPRAVGPNNLIRDGALLVRDGNDIADHLAERLRPSLDEPGDDLFQLPPSPPPEPAERAATFDKILGKLGPTPLMVDELVRQCQVSPDLVSFTLLELELAGRLERQPGNRVALLVEER